MPVFSIITNVELSKDAKAELASKITSEAAEIIRTSPNHCHVHIANDFFSFGGDSVSPAACVTCKCAALQIGEEARKLLVSSIVPMLEATLKCDPMRVTTFFQEFPVECIAVGSQVMTFSTQRTSPNGLRKSMS